MDFSKFNDETTIIPSTSAESKEVSGSGEQDQVMKGGAPRLSGAGPLMLATVQEEPNLNEVTNMSNMMIHDLSLNYSEDIQKSLVLKRNAAMSAEHPEQSLGPETLALLEQSLNVEGPHRMLRSQLHDHYIQKLQQKAFKTLEIHKL